MEPGICQRGLCSHLEVRPIILHFKFKANSKRSEHGEFQIKNVTNEQLAILIGTPLSEFFHIVPILAKGYVAPGETIKVAVNLKSWLENRIHYDVIRVDCPKGCAVDVALEAVPKVRPLKSVPRLVNLGHVPLGETRIKKVQLRPIGASDVLFVLLAKRPVDDLEISPTRGVLSAGQSPVEIALSYRPTAFVTLNVDVSLYLPTVLLNPFVFTVTAFTEPGFTRTLISKQPSGEKIVVNPLKERIFTHPTWLLKPFKPIPAKKNLPVWSQHKTNKILFKHMKEKRSEYELLGPLGRYLDEEEAVANRKDEEFIQEATLVHRSNFLAYSHTKTRLREYECPDVDRTTMWSDYLQQYEMPKMNTHGRSFYLRQRTIKRIDVETKTYEFTNKLPNCWFPRYVTMSKFIEAGRRIIHKNRLMKVLRQLRQLTKESVVTFESPPVEPY